MKAVYNRYKSTAAKKKREFKLTQLEFNKLITSNCFYCSRIPSNTIYNYNKKSSFNYNGVDRIDSSRGYTTDNVLSAYKNCNKAKNNLTLNQFYDMYCKVAGNVMARKLANKLNKE